MTLTESFECELKFKWQDNRQSTALTRTHARAHTHTLTVTATHSLTESLTHSQSLTQSLTHTHSHSLTVTHSQWQPLTHSVSHTVNVWLCLVIINVGEKGWPFELNLNVLAVRQSKTTSISKTTLLNRSYDWWCNSEHANGHCNAFIRSVGLLTTSRPHDHYLVVYTLWKGLRNKAFNKYGVTVTYP